MLLTKKPCPYAYITLILVATFFIYNISLIDRSPVDTVRRIHKAVLNLQSPPDYFHFNNPGSDRSSDTSDVFADYKHQDMCQISSLDLHVPFEPLCPDMESVLQAMSWGGRPGFDAPYIPHGCDMRFYTSAEMCEILGRFSGVVLMGDSIVRHITNAFWILMRGDMGYGAIRSWDIYKKNHEKEECACRNQFADSACNTIGFHQGDWKTKEAKDEDRSHVCGSEFPSQLKYQPMLDYPLDPAYLKGLMSSLPMERPEKPVAMVFGHALWNNVDLNKTAHWMDEVLESVEKRKYSSGLPKLFVSTNAGGSAKPHKWLQTQSVNNMAAFEIGVQPLVAARDMDFLGTYNMSVQAGSVDGTHATL